MSRSYQQMRVRLPPELKSAIEGLAAFGRRSANAEIIVRLEQSVAATMKELAGGVTLDGAASRQSDHQPRVNAA